MSLMSSITQSCMLPSGTPSRVDTQQSARDMSPFRCQNAPSPESLCNFTFVLGFPSEDDSWQKVQSVWSGIERVLLIS